MTSPSPATLSWADVAQADDPGRIWMSITRLKTARSAVRSRPCPLQTHAASGMVNAARIRFRASASGRPAAALGLGREPRTRPGWFWQYYRFAPRCRGRSGGAGHAEPDDADVLRRLRHGDLLQQDGLVAVRRDPAAVLLGPGQPHVAGLPEPAGSRPCPAPPPSAGAAGRRRDPTPAAGCRAASRAARRGTRPRRACRGSPSAPPGLQGGDLRDPRRKLLLCGRTTYAGPLIVAPYRSRCPIVWANLVSLTAAVGWRPR